MLDFALLKRRLNLWTMARVLWLTMFSGSFWGPLDSVVDSRLSRRFLLGCAWASGAGGVGPSACFRF